MHQLEALIGQLENKIPKLEIVNQQISQGSVGWHIEHTLLVINSVIENLQKSNPGDYQWKFNFIRTLVLTMRKIPRGRAQSPKSVQPKTNFNTETLKTHVAVTMEKIKALESLQRNHFFEHPFFGKLNLKPTIKFLLIHTKHHIHIINDILEK